jgi:hypothetical protein
MLFAQIFEKAECPLPGYEGLAVQVLANPTGKEWREFLTGGTGADPLLTRADGEIDADWAARVDASRTARRAQFGAILSTLYGKQAYGPLDFTTTEAALATVEHDDLPDEIVLWLLEVPITVHDQRIEAMQKKLRQPSIPQG